MSAGGGSSKERTFPSGVGDLRRTGAAGEIIPDDDVVEKVIT